jgi:DNA-binding CsgD family transcriptional regulator
MLSGAVVEEVMAGVGTPWLAAHCLRSLQQMLPTTFCTVFVVMGNGRIASVSAASLYGNAAERTAAIYCDRRFDRQDPQMTWLSRRKLPAQTKMWLGHHLSSDLQDDEYRCACYDEVGIKERASILLLAPSGTRAAVSFYRSFTLPDFTEQDFNLIARHASFLGSVVAAHVRAWRSREVHQATTLESQLLGLSFREREVLDQLLQGRSGKQAAHELGISLSTVRTLQYRAFRRLGIRTVNSLLRMASGIETFSPPAPRMLLSQPREAARRR